MNKIIDWLNYYFGCFPSWAQIPSSFIRPIGNNYSFTTITSFISTVEPSYPALGQIWFNAETQQMMVNISKNAQFPMWIKA